MARGWEGTLASSPALPWQRGTGGCVPLLCAQPAAMPPGAAMLPRGSGVPQLPQGSAVGRHPPAQSPRNPPSLPDVQSVPLPFLAGTPHPAPMLRSLPNLVGGLGQPQSEPTPAAEHPRRGMAGTDGCLSLPVPGHWPIDGGGVSRLGTGPGSKCPCPCWQPGGPEDPRQHPGTPLAPAPPACSNPERGEASSPGKCLWVLLPRWEMVA